MLNKNFDIKKMNLKIDLYKERFANFFKRRVDLSGNIGRNYYLMVKNKKFLASLKKDRKFLMKRKNALNQSIFSFFILARIGKIIKSLKNYNFLEDLIKIKRIFQLKKK